MRNIFVILFFALLSFAAHADVLRFTCATQDLQQLQLRLDSSHFHPEIANQNIDFVFFFNGQMISWNNVLALSGPIATGNFITSVRANARDSFYLEYNANAEVAVAELYLTGKKYDFDCTVNK